MKSFLVVYLSGQNKGKAKIFSQETVTIGTAIGCDVQFEREEGLEGEGSIFAEVHQSDHFFELVERRESGCDIFLNGEHVGELSKDSIIQLRNGDILEFCNDEFGEKLLFQTLPEDFDSLHLVRKRDMDSLKTAGHEQIHPLTATLFVKELARSLWTEIPSRSKTTGALIATAVLLIIISTIYFVFAELHRTNERLNLLTWIYERDRQEREKDKADTEKYKEEIRTLRESVNQSQVLAEKIVTQYGPGVCLIQGVYSFVEPRSGRELRYRDVNEAGQPLGGKEGFPVAIDGTGPVFEEDFTGTGFLVAEGVILTNRHVIQPWWRDDTAQQIMGEGFRPNLKRLYAYFPAIRTRFDLKIREISAKGYDIALCTFDQGDFAIPVLPLDTSGTALNIGQPVVLLGYPTGVDGLLERVDEATRQEMVRLDNQSLEEITQELANRAMIRPLNTQGNVNDITSGRIVHSAHTTEGGSGGPLFNRDMVVVGINYAIMASTETGAAVPGFNFGLPIQAGVEMLQTYQRQQRAGR